MTTKVRSSYLAIGGIMVALMAWGAFHAVGAFRYNHNLWRSVVVLASMGLFLGCWGALLAYRKRSPRPRDDRPS